MKKTLLLLMLPLLVLTGCGGDESHGEPVFSAKTEYTEEELKSVGLSGLEFPSGITDIGDIDKDGSMWIAAFHYEGTKEDHASFAKTIYSYLSSHYDDGYYGKAEMYASTSDDSIFFYNLTSAEDESGCYTTNPVPRYEFYYSTSKEVETDKYLPTDSVYEITLDYDDNKVSFFLDYAKGNNRITRRFKPNPKK